MQDIMGARNTVHMDVNVEYKWLCLKTAIKKYKNWHENVADYN